MAERLQPVAECANTVALAEVADGVGVGLSHLQLAKDVSPVDGISRIDVCGLISQTQSILQHGKAQ